MTDQISTKLRQLFSLAAFAAVIATVTLTYADAPSTTTRLSYDAQEPGLTALHEHQIDTQHAVPLKRVASKTPVAGSSKESGKAGLVGTLNLNTASTTDLIKLPGIGPKKAERIVDWRGSHGKFRRVVDLRRVRGFGAKSVRKLMPYLSVKGASTLE